MRQGSMRSDARVSGEYTATKGLVGERIQYTTLESGGSIVDFRGEVQAPR